MWLMILVYVTHSVSVISGSILPPLPDPQNRISPSRISSTSMSAIASHLSDIHILFGFNTETNPTSEGASSLILSHLAFLSHLYRGTQPTLSKTAVAIRLTPIVTTADIVVSQLTCLITRGFFNKLRYYEDNQSAC